MIISVWLASLPLSLSLPRTDLSLILIVLTLTIQQDHVPHDVAVELEKKRILYYWLRENLIQRSNVTKNVFFAFLYELNYLSYLKFKTMFGIIWLNYIIKKEYICNILAYDKLAYLQDLYYCSLVLINSYYSINRLVSCKFSGFLSLTDLANNLQLSNWVKGFTVVYLRYTGV